MTWRPIWVWGSLLFFAAMLSSGVLALIWTLDGRLPITELADPIPVNQPIRVKPCERAACEQQPLPAADREWSAGETMYIWRRFCVHHVSTAEVSRWIENASRYSLPDFTYDAANQDPKGCYEGTVAVEIPAGAFPNSYRFRERLSQPINPLKRVVYDLRPVTFTITGNPLLSALEEIRKELDQVAQKSGIKLEPGKPVPPPAKAPRSLEDKVSMMRVQIEGLRTNQKAILEYLTAIDPQIKYLRAWTLEQQRKAGPTK